jgi:hypothetical protein
MPSSKPVLVIGSLNMAVLPNDYTPVIITNPLTNEPLTVYNQKAETVGRRDTVVGNQNELDSDYNGLELRLNMMHLRLAHV